MLFSTVPIQVGLHTFKCTWLLAAPSTVPSWIKGKGIGVVGGVHCIRWATVYDPCREHGLSSASVLGYYVHWWQNL